MNLLGGMTFCPLCESAYDFPRSLQISGDFARLTGLRRSPQTGVDHEGEDHGFLPNCDRCKHAGGSTVVYARHGAGARRDQVSRLVRTVASAARGRRAVDETKPIGLGQNAPLTPEYQAKLEWSIHDQREGGQGLDIRYTCITNA